MFRPSHSLLRLCVLVALLVFDGLIILREYRQGRRLPFSLPPAIEEKIDQVLPSPIPTQKDPKDGLEFSDGQWVGSIVYGKLTNHNDYPVVHPQLFFTVSKTRDSPSIEASFLSTISAKIDPSTSIYFSQRFTTPKIDTFWWSASIFQVASYSGQIVNTPPRGQRVSSKRIAPPNSITPTDSGPWGVAKQIDEVTWTIKVGEDERIGTPQEIYNALNDYRGHHGSPRLEWDQTLATYAQERASHLNSIRTTDQHKGFKEYTASEENVRRLGFWSLGENSGYGHKLLGVHLVEWVYAGDPGHNDNQLSKAWSHVGIGVEGLGVVFIFGGNKI